MFHMYNKRKKLVKDETFSIRILKSKIGVYAEKHGNLWGFYLRSDTNMKTK